MLPVPLLALRDPGDPNLLARIIAARNNPAVQAYRRPPPGGVAGVPAIPAALVAPPAALVPPIVPAPNPPVVLPLPAAPIPPPPPPLPLPPQPLHVIGPVPAHVAPPPPVAPGVAAGVVAGGPLPALVIGAAVPLAVPVPVPAPAPIGLAGAAAAAGVNLAHMPLVLIRTPIFYNERRPGRGLLALLFVCLTIIISVADKEPHHIKAAFKASGIIILYDCFMYYNKLDRLTVGSFISLFINFFKCGLIQVPYTERGHRGQRFDNPLSECTQLCVYNDHMGRPLSLLAENYTHFRHEDIYEEMYDYLWSKRAGNQNSPLLMSWLSAEASHTFGIRDMDVTLSTVKAVYQRILATRLEESKAYSAAGSGSYASLSF